MNDSLSEIWQLTLQELSKSLYKPSFETWFNLTRPVSLENNCLVIEVPNDFTKEWFESRYRDQISKALKEVTSDNLHVSFVIASEFQCATDSSPVQDITNPVPVFEEPTIKKEFKREDGNRYVSSFNPRYTFDTFVVGNCNRLSHAASLAVAESPARAYNPLFIYGGG